MTKKTQDSLHEAKRLLAQTLIHAESGSFAHELQANSLRSHINDLEKIAALEVVSNGVELIDFRFIANIFKAGVMPLNIVAKAADQIQKLIGYTALRLTPGGIDLNHVPEKLYQQLDLRLVGILPGSARLVVVTAANRDLFDDGIAKQSIERILHVLKAGDKGNGDEFLERVTALGPFAAKRLRGVLHIAQSNDAKLELTWSYQGQQIDQWNGDRERVRAVTEALEQTEQTDHGTITLSGVVELLNKRERINIRSESNELFKILFPKRMLTEVSKLHLNQTVSLRCQVMETQNQTTKETSTQYELLSIES